MHSILIGTIFVGYAGAHVCENCKNKTIHGIRQEFRQSTVVFITLPKSYYHVYKICPVCEKKTGMIGIQLLASKDAWSNLHRELNAGREFTKTWIMKLGAEEQDQALKRLNALKAYSLVAYVCQ